MRWNSFHQQISKPSPSYSPANKINRSPSNFSQESNKSKQFALKTCNKKNVTLNSSQLYKSQVSNKSNASQQKEKTSVIQSNKILSKLSISSVDISNQPYNISQKNNDQRLYAKEIKQIQTLVLKFKTQIQAVFHQFFNNQTYLTQSKSYQKQYLRHSIVMIQEMLSQFVQAYSPSKIEKMRAQQNSERDISILKQQKRETEEKQQIKAEEPAKNEKAIQRILKFKQEKIQQKNYDKVNSRIRPNQQQKKDKTVEQVQIKQINNSTKELATELIKSQTTLQVVKQHKLLPKFSRKQAQIQNRRDRSKSRQNSISDLSEDMINQSRRLNTSRTKAREALDSITKMLHQ